YIRNNQPWLYSRALAALCRIAPRYLGRVMKLLDQLRQLARVKHMALATERAYVYWAERYIRFHGIRHPISMGAAEIESFLTHLAVQQHVSASTQNQALAGLLFLYRDVLRVEIGKFD